MKYNLGDIVVMKKNHPCGNNKFEIVRVGVYIKIRCVNCSRVIMLSRIDFNKGIRKVIGNYEEEK